MINRLQKKCFIVSTGMHSLLAVILFVGPAFLSPKNKIEEAQFLEMIPTKLVDGPVHMAGGAPRAERQIQPQPPQPAPPPRPADPPPQKDPTPVRDVVNRNDPEPDLTPTRRKPAISTKPVVRNNNSKATTKPEKTSDTREQQVADSRRAAADIVRGARQNLRGGLSSATDIDMPGSGVGEAYASYASAVRSIYEQAWIPPDDTTDDNAITKVSVTIEYTGKVVLSKITRASGETSVDRSVQRTLDRVTFIAPFPEGSKDKQRTYIINFNLRAKRGFA